MDNMIEYEIEIRDLKMKLECANDMIEAYKRECDALYSAMVKWARKCNTETDREQPPADVHSNAVDWLIPETMEIKSGGEKPFQDETSQDKIKHIQQAIRAFYHPDSTE